MSHVIRDLCAGHNAVTAPVCLLKFRGEGIVSITETFPFGSDIRSIDHTIWVLGENNGKSSLPMPLSSESVNYGVDGGFGWKERT